MTTLRRWGQRWLDDVEASAAFGPEAIERGRAYALHDWQLDLHIEPGKAETTARSGPRVRHEVTVAVPPLTDTDQATFLDLLAGSGTHTAGLLERDLDLAVMDDAAGLDVHLLPDPAKVTATCTCPHDDGFCKHIAAAVLLLAEGFDEDPFDLLLLRGLSHADIVERVSSLRAATDKSAEEGASPAPPQRPAPVAPRRSAPAAELWARDAELTPLPAELPALEEPAATPEWGGKPPARSPFSASGLQSIAADGIERAHTIVRSAAGTTTSHLGLDQATDTARRADRAERDGRLSSLAANAALTSQELRARLAAWRVAGAAGIDLLDNTVATEKVDSRLQYRQARDGRWFRFEKPSGRWLMVSGPFEAPHDIDQGDAGAITSTGDGQAPEHSTDDD